MIGVLLLGGSGKRLKPISDVVNKHLLPVYNKPLVYYSLSVLFLLKVKKIILVTNRSDKKLFFKLLGNGRKYGVKFTYVIQDKPKGIINALSLTKKKIGKENFILLLGDNFFYGNNFFLNLKKKISKLENSFIVCKEVSNPNKYGMLFKNKKKFYIKEKPKKISKEALAVTGLYFYKNNVLQYLNRIRKSKRNEYEISDLNNILLRLGLLDKYEIPRGNVWFDCGTISDFNNVGKFVEIIENRQDLIISSLAEICYRNQWIDKKQLKKLAINKKEIAYFSDL